MTTRRTFIAQAAAGSAAALAGIRLAHATQGVTKDQIVIGSIQDLSGPIAALGKYVHNGMVLRVESINAAGGIHGRKIKLIVEDSNYDPKKSVLAAQKLVTQDRIFAMIGTLGSPTTLASMPVVLEKNVLHLFPVSSHTATYEPFHKLKFSTANPYPNSTRIGVEQMLKMKPYKRVAILYQDDEYGIDVLNGTESALKAAGLSLVETTSYKGGGQPGPDHPRHDRARDARGDRRRPAARLHRGLPRQRGGAPAHGGQGRRQARRRALRGQRHAGPVSRHAGQLQGAGRLDRFLQGALRGRPRRVFGGRLAGDRHLCEGGGEGRS
jgi:hypothetical protein